MSKIRFRKGLLLAAGIMMALSPSVLLASEQPTTTTPTAPTGTSTKPMQPGQGQEDKWKEERQKREEERKKREEERRKRREEERKKREEERMQKEQQWKENHPQNGAPAKVAPTQGANSTSSNVAQASADVPDPKDINTD